MGRPEGDRQEDQCELERQERRDVADGQLSPERRKALDDAVGTGGLGCPQQRPREEAEVVRDAIVSSLDTEYTEKREADAEHTHADVSKARELLGYDPIVDIREGVEKFIEWYRENEDWYDPLVKRS